MSRRSVGVLICLAVPAFLLPMGCDTSPTDSLGDFRPVLVVEGFLTAGEPVEGIYVGTTMPLYEVYDRNQSAISDAKVTIEVDSDVSSLQPVTGSPGIYHLPGLEVQSGKTYLLTAQAEDFVAQPKPRCPIHPPSRATEPSSR